MHYNLQVQQEMACAGLDRADLVALFIGTFETRIYEIVRRDDLIDELMRAELEFWGRIERQDPPLPDFEHPSTADIMAMLEPLPGNVVMLDEEAQKLVDDYESLAALDSSTKQRKKSIKSQLIHLMGKAEQGDLPDGRTVRRKVVNRKGYTAKPSSFVDFRILKGSRS